jgi:hypothetical protein
MIQQDQLKADESASKLTNTLNDDTGINVIDNYNEQFDNHRIIENLNEQSSINSSLKPSKLDYNNKNKIS